MDWADDISYAIHDVEDFFRAGMIPLDLLASSDKEWEDFLEYAWDSNVSKFFPAEGSKDRVTGWLENVRREYFPTRPYSGSREDREDLHRFASNLIRDTTDGTALTEPGIVTPEPEHLARIEVLKRLTWYYVIDRPELESVQRGQRFLIRSLYRNLIEWVEQVWRGPREASRLHQGGPVRPAKPRSAPRELPARLLDYLEIAFSHYPEIGCINYKEPAKIARAVVDYIVSLTEIQAIELNSRLTGYSVKSMFDSWFQA
jgi:dGTPase